MTKSDIDLEKVEVVCDEIGCELLTPTKASTNIYHKQGTFENIIFKFCKKYRLSVRYTMSLLSLTSVTIAGVIIAGVADFLMHNAIFSIVDSVELSRISK